MGIRDREMGMLGPQDGGGNKSWGSSPDDVYFVGTGGSIVHWDGEGFEKLESGVDTRLIAVSGSSNGEYTFIAGYNFLLPIRTSAIMIRNNQLDILYDATDYSTDEGVNDWGAISGVDVYDGVAFWVTFRGLWKYYYRYGISEVDSSFTYYDYQPIVVNGYNDIFLLGGGFNYGHYNGFSWKWGKELYDHYFFASGGADFSGDLVVIVGYARNQPGGAVIARGYR